MKGPGVRAGTTEELKVVPHPGDHEDLLLTHPGPSPISTPALDLVLVIGGNHSITGSGSRIPTPRGV